MKRAEKRRHLIETAARLFNERGYHAVGVDQIIAEAGVAKTTLYRHFSTKEALTAEALKLQDEDFRDGMRAFVEARASAAGARILATFDYIKAWFEDAEFHGCPFVSATHEHAALADSVSAEALLHKRLVIAYFEELAHAAGLSDPKAAAREINLLHEGAVAVAHVLGVSEAAEDAKSIARRVLDLSDAGAG
ncbi:MAG: TetR/AcrR family transcriptional regulator [Sphingomonadales bacterium]|nr:TetR/AcrR family transcriptional regulator [Sphingomonadales bacterium]